MRALFARLVVVAALLAGCAAEEPRSPSAPVATSPAVTTPVASMPTATTPATTPTTSPADASDAEVEVSGFRFLPAQLTIAAGSVVRFDNQDAAAHTATAEDGSFHEALGDEPVEVVFDTPGTFPYRCEIHPSMRGTITVG